MNKRIAPPAPVSPLFAPMCLLPRIPRVAVLGTPGVGYRVMDTLFGQVVGDVHRTVDAADTAAQALRKRIRRYYTGVTS